MRNPLSALDIFVLDRVYQPLADRAASFTNCFAMARSAAIGAAVLGMMSFLDKEPSGFQAVLMILMLACVTALHRVATKQEQASKPGRANPVRFTWATTRTLMLSLDLLSVFLFLTQVSIGSATMFDAAGRIGTVLITASLYLSSCQPNPPQQTQNRFVHAGA